MSDERILDAFRRWGYLQAQLDPLGRLKPQPHPELDVTGEAADRVLEAVDPVVLGRARAKQARLGDSGRARVLCITLHGDAAFAGQGIVAETLNLADLRGFTVGGT